MTPEAFTLAAEAFVARHGRAAWRQVMADHGVDTLAGAIERREAIAGTMRQLEAYEAGRA